MIIYNFQCCDINSGLFSIAHCKVIALNILCLFFGIIYLLLSFIYLFIVSYCSSNYCNNYSWRFFLLLKAIAISFALHFATPLRLKNATTIAFAIVGRAITIRRAIQKISHEIYKTDTKNEAWRLRATTFAIAKLE